MKIIRSLLAALLFFAAIPVAQAQYQAIGACPGATAIQPAGSGGAVALVDVNGNLCISGTGGGPATIANGADVAEGATTDTASTAGGTGSVSAKLRLMTTQLGTINTTLGSPFQAGGSIGNTSFGISGTLPAFAATPTFNIGTAPTIAVTGTFFQTTQPVSIASMPSTPVTGTFFQATQPVSIAAAPLQPLGLTPTDRTIASASGSSQQIMAANASRHSLTIANTGNANCGVNPTGGTAAIGAAGTLTLAPLGSYTPRVPSLSAVTVICTAAQPIYGDEN